MLRNQKNTTFTSFDTNLISDYCDTDISTKRGKLWGVETRLVVFVLGKKVWGRRGVPKGAN